ncbi:MAG: extracellular solute-binding protein [Anaerolineae bacterium]|nr:extracellular solute-binding protein [Anaerolineae bacterium]
MRNRKWMLGVVLAALLVASVVNVRAQDDPLAGLDPSGVTLQYWHEWAGSQETGMDQIIENFNSTNEWGITVEQTKFGAGPGLSENLSTAITAGETPNLAGDGFVGRALGWYLDGVLVPLDIYTDSATWGLSEEERALINQELLAINRPALAPFDGQLLAWPVGISSNVMSVNLDLLAEAGFDSVPTTFEDFRAAACAVAELEETNGGLAMRISASELYNFILSFGGPVYDAEADRFVLTDDATLQALQYLQDLYNDDCAYIPEGGGFANTGEFSLGLNAFALGSSVGVPFIQGPMNEAGLEINWINTTTPWAEGNRTLPTFLRGVVMMQGTPEENLATWLFIKYWATDPEAQRIWTESAQYQPYNSAVPALISEEFLATNPPVREL